MGERALPGEKVSVRDACDQQAHRERESILRSGGKAPSQDQLSRIYRNAVENGDKHKERK